MPTCGQLPAARGAVLALHLRPQRALWAQDRDVPAIPKHGAPPMARTAQLLQGGPAVLLRLSPGCRLTCLSARLVPGLPSQNRVALLGFGRADFRHQRTRLLPIGPGIRSFALHANAAFFYHVVRPGRGARSGSSVAGKFRTQLTQCFPATGVDQAATGDLRVHAKLAVVIDLVVIGLRVHARRAHDHQTADRVAGKLAVADFNRIGLGQRLRGTAHGTMQTKSAPHNARYRMLEVMAGMALCWVDLAMSVFSFSSGDRTWVRSPARASRQCPTIVRQATRARLICASNGRFECALRCLCGRRKLGPANLRGPADSDPSTRAGAQLALRMHRSNSQSAAKDCDRPPRGPWRYLGDMMPAPTQRVGPVDRWPGSSGRQALDPLAFPIAVQCGPMAN